MEKRRVVITGIGMLTPFGSAEETWKNILAGNSAIMKIDWGIEVPKGTPKFGGPITKDTDGLYATYLQHKAKSNGNLSIMISTKDFVNKMDRVAQIAMIGALEAVTDAELNLKLLENAGVMIGSSFGGIETLLSEYRKLLSSAQKLSPHTIPRILSNLVAGNIAIALGCLGPNECPSAACASGALAIGNAVQKIQFGECDLVIAGGSEAALNSFVVEGFHASRALSTNSDFRTASRPFDVNRDGFVISEGAAVLILEELNHAINRDVRIYAEITGFGSACDASHITKPSLHGPISSMRKALEESGLSKNNISLINAHATSTRLGDVNELTALAQVFSDGYKPIVTANKSQLGHCLGAAGAIEAVLSIMSIRDGIAPQIINLDETDEKCGELGFVLPTENVEMDIEAVLTNSFGFGGKNVSLIIERFTN